MMFVDMMSKHLLIILLFVSPTPVVDISSSLLWLILNLLNLENIKLLRFFTSKFDLRTEYLYELASKEIERKEIIFSSAIRQTHQFELPKLLKAYLT